MREAPRNRPFVDRRQELETAREWLERAWAGEDTLLLVTGEPGIGKTRFLEELFDALGEGGANVVWEYPLRESDVPPLWPWRRIARALGRLAGESEASHRDLEASVADAGDAIVPAVERLAHALRGVSSEAPVAVVLEDLQWADRSTALALEALGQELRGDPVALVTTCCEHEVRRNDELGEIFESLRRQASRIRLLPLEDTEVLELITLVDEGVNEENATVIVENAGGNPLLVLETLRSDGFEELSTPVRDRIRRWTEAVSPACVRLLEGASIFPEGFRPESLSAVGLGRPEVVKTSLAEALVAGLLRGDRETWRFAGGFMRAFFAERLAPDRSRDLHRRAAAAIDPGRDPHRWRIAARHWLAAGQRTRAVEALRRAARATSAASRYEEAATYLGEAAELAEAEERLEPMARCDLLVELGQARMKAGQRRAARGVLREAVLLARSSNHATALAEAAVTMVGEGDVLTRMDHRTVAILEEALERLGSEPSPLRIRLLGRLAMALYFTSEHHRADPLSAEAVGGARLLNDPGALASALSTRLYALWGPDHVAERRTLADEILELSAPAGFRELEMGARFWRFVMALECADLTGAFAELGRYAELAEVLGRPYYRWHLETLRASLALAQGCLEDAERLIEKSVGVGASLESRNPPLVAGMQLFILRREQGRFDELEPMTRAFVAEHPTIPAFRAGLAQVLAGLGQEEGARAELERLAAEGFASIPRDGNWLNAVDELASVVASVGDEARAGELYALLEPHADQAIVLGFGEACDGSASRPLGMLAATCGRFEEAGQHFEAARRVNETMGAKPALARTLAEHARMLSRRGRSGDGGRARELASEAVAVAREVGMERLVSNMEEMTNGSFSALHVAGEGKRRAVFRRDGQAWRIGREGETRSIRHRRGLAWLALLLQHPGREFHALELEALARGTETTPRAATRDAAMTFDSSGAEPDLVLDERAKKEIRGRLSHLAAELEEAEAFHDEGRAAKIRAEIDAVTSHLSSAIGLGGKSRAHSTPAERARSNLTHGIRSALRLVEAEVPELGAHLRESIQTGTFFSYKPREDRPVDWAL